MDELLFELFERSKAQFYAILENKESNKLFHLLETITDNKDNGRLSSYYSSQLYDLINYYSGFYGDLREKSDFSYIISISELLSHIHYCINDDGQLYFLKIKVQSKPMLEEFLGNLPEPIIENIYTLSVYEQDKDVINSVVKFGLYDSVIAIDRVIIDNYEMLFSIISEIINNDNWKLICDEVTKNSYYSFAKELAFEKYFGKE